MSEAKLQADIDWPALIQQHDMHWSDLPDGWQAGAHFGNAMLGSMLYQVDNTIRLQVFRQDVHDHRDESQGWTAYSRPRLMIGHFALEPVGTLTGCNWRKNLYDAELTGAITTDKGEITIRHFVHANDMAIVTELGPTDGEANLTWTWHPAPAETSRPGYPTTRGELGPYAKRYGERHRETIKLRQPNPEGRLERHGQGDGQVNVWVQNLLAGGQYATAWAEARQGNTHTHIATITNSFPESTAAADAVANVQRFAQANREAWVDEHRAWWHGYYQQSCVTLPDARIESLYWQTVYRLGCNSRAGRHYIDTSGIWFQGGPWAYSTHDWNTQSAHWGVYAANRLDQGAEIVNRLHAGMDNLIDAVHPYEWREDSAYLPIATVCGMAGTRVGDMRYYHLLGNLPWLLHNVWWQYRFSMDDDMLRDVLYPLLKRAVNLYLHEIEDGDDGKLHLPRTYSPETGIYRDATFDLSLLKWSCHTLLAACDRLCIDDPLATRWQEVIDRLVDFPADDEGLMLAGDTPAPRYHRHLSHLLAIYPLYLLHVDQPDARALLDAVHKRVQITVQGPDDVPKAANQAMLQTHAAPIACALGKDDDALAGLQMLADDLLPNGLWACAGNPCFESSVSLMSVAQDMLIQSWSDPAALQRGEPGPIRIFPAVPKAWGDVAFTNLRAEGAFLVSATRKAGTTTRVKIESLAGEPCTIKLPGNDELTTTNHDTAKLTRLEPGLYRIDLAQGQSIELTAPGTNE